MHHLQIDRLACQDSPVHRFDSRIKLVAAIVYTVFVISLPATAVSVLACFAVGPFSLLMLANIPLRFAAKQTLIIMPFVLVLALSTVYYDRTPVEVAFGPFGWDTTAGLLRCVSILGKFVITVGVLIVLVGSTRFGDLLGAMARLGVPSILVMQIGFLYRYIFLLTDRARHMIIAKRARTVAAQGFRRQLKTASAMIGSLFAQSLDTATRVNMAMRARGFAAGTYSKRPMHLSKADRYFIVVFVIYLAVLGLLRVGY